METIFKDVMRRCEAVIKDKWPSALDGGAFAYAMAHHSDLHSKFWTLDKEANELWVNDQPTQFKKVITDWGRTVIEIHKLYAQSMKEAE